jgi:biotin-[acetyl-CoA-carboxylase] ligase BirA-like protein
MEIITDNIEFSNSYFSTKNGIKNSVPLKSSQLVPVFLSEPPKSYTIESDFWHYAYVTEFAEKSQFDLLTKLTSQKTEIPHKSLFIAGHGKNFHGFRSRRWESLPGNIHLSCHFKPMLKAVDVGLGFTLLSAVSVIDALDSIPELAGKAGIKWVNDVVIDNSKVAGVIAQTQVQGEFISDAVIGIGLNVEAVPIINSTSFVPKASSVNAESNRFYTAGFVNSILIDKIAENYNILSQQGLRAILDKYRNRSIIIGKHISVWSDPHSGEQELLCSGVVESIGENLELYLSGQDKPVTSGRIVPD